jgi:hypothetical protein
MLNAVSQSVNHQTRMVVLYHPNAIPCYVHRKKVKRTEIDPESGAVSESMGMPTMGGLGVLKSEDESEIEYVELGEGRYLICGQFQPTDINERDDGLLAPNAQEAKVEPMAEVGQDGYFVADVGDLVFLDLGAGVVVALEVVKIIGSINIPPYNRRLVLNPRDELHNLVPFTA